jgi:hypothetical protein
MKMQKIIAIAGIVCLLGIWGMSADLISSSITTDGTAWVSTSVLGERTYAATLFMNDRSAMSREMVFNQDVQSQTAIRSDGPVGVHEFSAQDRTRKAPAFLCSFADRVDNKTRYDEISTLGLWSNGTYVSSRHLRDEQTVALTDIDAAGMVSLNKRTDTENLTQRERSFIAGQMNISEAVMYEEEEEE